MLGPHIFLKSSLGVPTPHTAWETMLSSNPLPCFFSWKTEARAGDGIDLVEIRVNRKITTRIWVF